MALRRRRLLLILLSGCDVGSELIIDPLWPAGDPAILIVTDASGEILAPTPVFAGTKFAIDTRGAIILYAQTFSSLRERDLSGCRLSLDEGQDLGMPAGAWSSGPFRPGDAIALMAEEPAREFNLRIADCEAPPKPCELIGQGLDVPVLYSGLYSVASISDSQTIAGGGPKSEQDFRSVFLRSDAMAAVELPVIDGLAGYRAHIDDDGAGIVGGVASMIFRLDYGGSLVSTSSVPFEVVSVSTGFDGTTMFAGRRGQIAAMSKGSTTARAIEPPEYRDFEKADEPKIAAVREDLFLLYGLDGNVYEFDGAWSLIFPEPVDAIAADARWFFLVPMVGAVLLYDRETREFDPAGNLFLTERAKNATAFGDGRFLACGQGGLVGYYNGEQLCPVSSGIDRNVEDVDVAPGGRVIYAVDEQRGELPSRPIFLRFTFP